MTRFAAVDLGAQSGRVLAGTLGARTISATEVHRFPNVPVEVAGTLHWDVLRLFDGIIEGLRVAGRDPIASVGVDSWGLDFALLDRAGHLLGNPVHHRDGRTADALEPMFELVPGADLYRRTGIQLASFNALAQLFTMARAGDPALEHADRLLMIADLFHHWLGGRAACERTLASTSQCLDVEGAWADDMLASLGVPPAIFGEVVEPGTVLGELAPGVAKWTRLGGAAVVAPASHDTASAVAAIPLAGPGAAYISSGTWSLVGVEIEQPIVDELTMALSLTNEYGLGGTVRLLRNVTAMWLVHDCLRTWRAGGEDWTVPDLLELAAAAPPFRSLIDPDHPSLLTAGDMPERIAALCRASDQPAPADAGATVRCILESLALKYRQTLDGVAEATGSPITHVHVVGGGARNSLLCQWTADAMGLPVIAGPVEATAIGNLLVQAIAVGRIASLAEARALVEASFAPTLYEPLEAERWEAPLARFTERFPDTRRTEAEHR